VGFAALGIGLVALRHALAASHDPNAEHVETRLLRGRDRALTRAEHERKESERDAGPTPA
jgi:hypothetical protein